MPVREDARATASQTTATPSAAPPGPAVAGPEPSHAAFEGYVRSLKPGAAVQASSSGSPRLGAKETQATAAKGVSGAGGPLPHGDRIQAQFGHHDISGVSAHVGGAAAGASEKMGARAFAVGDQVAFREGPDLHTAAHEAAHVVQQQAGVHLAGGVGAAGDRYEVHADAVADTVVRGESAEGLLDSMAGGERAGGHAGSAVQKKEDKDKDKDKCKDAPKLKLGAKGPAVTKLQQALNARGTEPPLKVSGELDEATVTALEAFQTKSGLTASGELDDATAKALDLAAATPDIGANEKELGQHVADRMDTANTGPYGLDVGIHYSYNFESECQKAGKPELWKDDYRMGYADPTYFKRVGFMDWRLNQKMSASAAIKSWLRGLTVAECNSAVVAMEIDALRAGISDKKFDEMFGSPDKDIPEHQRLRIKPGTQGTPVETYMKRPDLAKKKAEKGAKGEELTDKDVDDTLKTGEWYYFYNHPKYLLKHPGGAWQGENSLYMGKKGGQRMWSGLGASNVSEDGMFHEMVSAYNAPRDKNDERVMKERGIKAADGTYKDKKYDPAGGVFTNKVTKKQILKDPAYSLGGVTRKGGFLAEAGITLDAEKVKKTRDEK